jgi:hypothetical protein
VTGRGEPVEPCAGYSLGNDSHAQLFITLCIIKLKDYEILNQVQELFFLLRGFYNESTNL